MHANVQTRAQYLAANKTDTQPLTKEKKGIATPHPGTYFFFVLAPPALAATLRHCCPSSVRKLPLGLPAS